MKFKPTMQVQNKTMASEYVVR